MINRQTSSALRGVATVILLAAAVGVPMLWLHRDSMRNLISFHGTLHAALGQRLAGGVIPPENPFFAGETVRYYWLYHALGYFVGKALNLSVVYAFEILSILSLLILAGAAVLLGRRLWASTTVGALIYLLVLAGSNPLGWAILLAKVARDGLRITRAPAEAVVSPLLQQVQFEDHRFGPNFTFFMHMTSRAVSIALLILAVWLVWEWMRKGRPASAIALAATTALMVAFSPVLGLACAGALGLSLLAQQVWQRRGAPLLGDGERLARIISTVFLLGLGSLLALPTLLNIVGKTTNSPTVGLDATRLKLYAIIVINGFPLLGLAWLGTRAAAEPVRAFNRALLVAGGILMAWTSVLKMPGTIPPDGVIGNEHNLFNAAIGLLAVPAASWVTNNNQHSSDLRPQRLRRRSIALLVLFLPTAFLILSAYTGRAALPVRCAPDRLIWTDASTPTAELYEWVVANTPADAVFVVDPDPKIDRLCNVSDFPAFTNRTLYTDFSTYMTEAYPEEAFRLHWSRTLARGETVPRDVHEALVRMKRPLFLLTYHADDEGLAQRLQARYGVPVFQVGPLAVFGWMP